MMYCKIRKTRPNFYKRHKKPLLRFGNGIEPQNMNVHFTKLKCAKFLSPLAIFQPNLFVLSIIRYKENGDLSRYGIILSYRDFTLAFALLRCWLL